MLRAAGRAKRVLEARPGFATLHGGRATYGLPLPIETALATISGSRRASEGGV